MLEHETPTLAAATSTTVRCPFCAEEIQQQAIYCRFCSRNVATGQAGQQPTKQSTGETTGLLMLAVPILATVLILFWIGNMNLLQAPASKLGLLAVVTVAVTAILGAKEASDLGMGTRLDARGKKGTGPAGWFLGMLLLWVFVYPGYLFERRKYGKKNLLIGGILVATVFILVAVGMGKAIADRQQEVQNLLNSIP